MCNLTIVNPTKDPFNIGTGINQPCNVNVKEGAYITIGSGTVVTYIATELLGNGSYSAFGFSGDWSIEISQNSDGTWDVEANFTGSGSGYSRTFTANGSQVSSPPSITFTDTQSSDSVVLSQDNGSIITDGRIEINPNWAPTSIYLDSNV